MKKLKVRKIGNSLGSIFPKDWEVREGATLNYEVDKKNHKVIIDLNYIDIEHERNLTEKSFSDFEKHEYLSEKDMQAKFGKYGWTK